MERPENFGLDLATRIALHEMLIQKLFANLLRDHPNLDDALDQLRHSLTSSFDVSVLNAGGAPLTEPQQEWVRQQSAYGKQLSNRFVSKIEGFVRSKQE